MARRGTTVPVHTALLDSFEQRLVDRKATHERKCGKGLPQDAYLQHVGRIAEIDVMLGDIATLRKQLRQDEDI